MNDIKRVKYDFLEEVEHNEKNTYEILDKLREKIIPLKYFA